MENSSNPDCAIDPYGFLGTPGGKFADAHDPFGSEQFNDAAQVSVARCEKGVLLRTGEFVWSSVASAVFHECQRAIVHDDVFPEKILRHSKSPGKQTPESPAAHLRAGAIEPADCAFGMLVGGFPNGRLDAQPVSHRGDFSERNSGLGHSERAGIHAHENDALGSGGVPSEVRLMGSPGIIQGIVDVRNGRTERQGVDSVTQFECKFNPSLRLSGAVGISGAAGRRSGRGDATA